jgi:hypothetical protein
LALFVQANEIMNIFLKMPNSIYSGINRAVLLVKAEWNAQNELANSGKIFYLTRETATILYDM